jgi:hypothetical protein
MAMSTGVDLALPERLRRFMGVTAERADSARFDHERRCIVFVVEGTTHYVSDHTYEELVPRVDPVAELVEVMAMAHHEHEKRARRR